MASIINADTSDGLKITSDTSGQIDFQSAGSTKALIDTAGNLKFDSGYGSVATGYGCRAWVNFNGTSTVAIRDSGNVSSVTDNGTGDYTVNFTNAMPDVNYAVVMTTTGSTTTTNNLRIMQVQGTDATGAATKTTSAVRILRGITHVVGALQDGAEINVVVLR